MKRVKVYYQPMCGPSRLILKSFSNAKIDFEKVDIRGCGNDVVKYDIRATPTVLLLENDQVVAEFIGRDKDRIAVNKIKEFLDAKSI